MKQTNKTTPLITFIDIETSPILGFTWGAYEQNVLEVKEDWDLLSFAAKAGDGRTKVYSGNEEELVKKLWNVFDESDILVAHNGDKFDIKMSNAKFLEYGLLPPRPYKTIDTLKVAKKYFRLTSNKLDHVARFLGVGAKMKHAGMSMWFDVMDGDKKATRMMEKYNKQDVEILYKVYMKLRPWIVNHPNHGVYIDSVSAICPNCGSANIQSRGFSVTKTGRKKRYQCQACGSWSHGATEKVAVVS